MIAQFSQVLKFPKTDSLYTGSFNVEIEEESVLGGEMIVDVHVKGDTSAG